MSLFYAFYAFILIIILPLKNVIVKQYLLVRFEKELFTTNHLIGLLIKDMN